MACGWHGACIEQGRPATKPSVSMETSRARIRDTSGQDRAPASAPPARSLRDPRILAAGAAAVLIGLAAWVAVGWSSGGRSYDNARIRIAEVVRGDLVRDISADGRVI